MTFPRVSLGLVGAVLLGLGIAFLVAPEAMAEVIAIRFEHPRTAIEITAMYGGFEVGLGIFFLVAATRERWIRAALAVQFLGLGGLALGRLIGMAQAPAGDRLMLGFFLLETAGAGIGLWAFQRARVALATSHFERHRPEPG